MAEQYLSIQWAERPTTASLDGQELSFPHAYTQLIKEGEEPFVIQQLHAHNWEGFKFAPNVLIGPKEDNRYGQTQKTTLFTGPELYMWCMWNHGLEDALEKREKGMRGELLFGQNFHEAVEAHNCRKAARSALEAMGVSLDPSLAASQAGMGGQALPVKSVFSFEAVMPTTLEEQYARNKRLVDALIPPWKMNRIPTLPSADRS